MHRYDKAQLNLSIKKSLYDKFCIAIHKENLRLINEGNKERLTKRTVIESFIEQYIHEKRDF